MQGLACLVSAGWGFVLMTVANYWRREAGVQQWVAVVAGTTLVVWLWAGAVAEGSSGFYLGNYGEAEMGTEEPDPSRQTSATFTGLHGTYARFAYNRGDGKHPSTGRGTLGCTGRSDFQLIEPRRRQ